MSIAQSADLSAPQPLAPSARWALASLSLTMLMSALGTSIANVGLPTFMHAFAASFEDVQWVVLAYLLAITTLIVSVGRLGDQFGRRRLLLAGLLLFTVASLLCAVAPNLAVLILARGVQGLGGAIMMALTLAFVGEAVPKAKTGSAMGLLGSMSAIGTALGPSLGGVLIDAFGWPALFLVNLPLGLLAALLVGRHLPADRASSPARPGRFDLPGTLLLALTLAAYALALTLGRGHFGVLNVVLFASALAGGVLFVIAESRAASPLIRLALFRSPQLSSGFASSALVTTVVMATLVVGPFYLVGAFALDAAGVGLVMSSGPIMAALTGVPAGRLVDRFGADRMTLVALGGMALGTILLATLPPRFGIAGYIVPLLLVTGGYATFQTANNTAVMKDVAPDQRGLVSALLNLARNLGLITGAALMGAVYAFGSAIGNGAPAPAEAAQRGLQLSFVLATLLVVLALVVTSACRALARRDSRSDHVRQRMPGSKQQD